MENNIIDNLVDEFESLIPTRFKQNGHGLRKVIKRGNEVSIEIDRGKLEYLLKITLDDINYSIRTDVDTHHYTIDTLPEDKVNLLLLGAIMFLYTFVAQSIELAILTEDNDKIKEVMEKEMDMIRDMMYGMKSIYDKKIKVIKEKNFYEQKLKNIGNS